MTDTKRATSIDVGTKVVDVTRNTKTSKGGKKYQCVWKLDFADVSDEQLLSLATRGIVIDLQRQFRDATPKQRDGLVAQNVDVGQLLATAHTRTTVDPRAAALKLLAGMTETERTDFDAERAELAAQ